MADSSSLFDDVRKHTNAVLRAETAAVRPTTKYAKKVARLERELIREWVRRYGDIASLPTGGIDDLIETYLSLLDEALELPGNFDRDVSRGLTEAATLGYQHGIVQTGTRPATAPPASLDSRRAVREAKESVSDARKAARRLLKRSLVDSLGFPGVLAATSDARATGYRVEAAVRWAVNNAANKGVERAVKELPESVVLMWVPERNACLHCLAYAGRTAVPGKDFPKGLTFGDKPLNISVRTPPLHPNCRCSITPWDTDVAGEGPLDAPDALKREAERSVLRGWTNDSQSQASRVRAAEKLLKKGVVAPKSVQDVAQKAVKNGKF